MGFMPPVFYGYPPQFPTPQPNQDTISQGYQAPQPKIDTQLELKTKKGSKFERGDSRKNSISDYRRDSRESRRRKKYKKKKKHKRRDFRSRSRSRDRKKSQKYKKNKHSRKSDREISPSDPEKTTKILDLLEKVDTNNNNAGSVSIQKDNHSNNEISEQTKPKKKRRRSSYIEKSPSSRPKKDKKKLKNSASKSKSKNSDSKPKEKPKKTSRLALLDKKFQLLFSKEYKEDRKKQIQMKEEIKQQESKHEPEASVTKKGARLDISDFTSSDNKFSEDE